ncbi:hypothetical protein Tco_1248624, partial [Tanacetum coccineum]
MGKMCLGKDVINISSDRNEGSGDWDSPEYKDTARSRGKKEPEALVFHKMDTEEDSDIKLCLEYKVRKGKKLVKKELMVLLHGEVYFVQFIINPEEDEFEPGLIFRRSFFDEEGNLNLDNLEELLDFDIDEADKVKLDGNIKPEEERAMVKVKGQMLKEKKDTRAFLFLIRLEGRIIENALADTGSDINTMPYRIYEQLGRDDIMKEERNITIINNTEAKVTGRLIAESDSDDEEDYVIKRIDMGTPIHNSRPIGYQNNIKPAEDMTLSTLESVINPFRKISMWKKAVSFLGSLPAKLRDVEWKPDYKLCYSNLELVTG